MTKIVQKVHHFLLKNPSVVRNLQQGIINTRALATHIKKREHLSASTHAVISAIRRFDIEEKKQEFYEIHTVLRNSRISTKSRLALITLVRDFKFLGRVFPEILRKIDPSVGGLLRLVEGRESFKLLIDHAKKEEILPLFPPTHFNSILDNLAEINIVIGKGYQAVRGVRATILNELEANNIRLYETISCLPEFIIIVNEEDVGKAHDALLSFFHK